MSSFKEMLQKVKESFVTEKISDVFKNIYVMISAFIILVIVLLLLIFSLNSGKSSKKNIMPVADLKDDLILPDEPGIQQEFQYFHMQKTKWTDEDAAEWFVKPNTQMMEELTGSNDKLISDILEAAP